MYEECECICACKGVRQMSQLLKNISIEHLRENVSYAEVITGIIHETSVTKN